MKSAPPSAETHPNTFAWFSLVGRFHDSVRTSWGGAAPAKAGAKPAAKEAPKEAPKASEDDDMDLFGDDEPDEVSFIFNRQALINY